MEECCDKGVEWANKNRICTSLPLISESRECRYTVMHYTLHENILLYKTREMEGIKADYKVKNLALK